MKSSLALVEFLLFLRPLNTPGVSLFSGVFSGSIVVSLSSDVFYWCFKNRPPKVVQKSTCNLLIADLFVPQFWEK